MGCTGKWDSKPVTKWVRDRLRENTKKVAHAYKAQVVRNITKKQATFNTGDFITIWTPAPRPVWIGGNRKYEHSKPWQWPWKMTGRLSESWVVEHETGHRIVSRVWSAQKHARWLEIGTVMMAPRPYLRRTLMVSHRKFATMWIR
jgi:hypothetical protein